MNVPERNPRDQQRQPPQQRRKTPSFSSSLLDSILRSMKESNDGRLDVENLHHQQQPQQLHHDDDDLILFSSEPKRSSKIHSPQSHSRKQEEIPNLRQAIMIDQWMENLNSRSNNRNPNSNVIRKSSRNFSSDSSSSGMTTFTTSSASSEIETPSTYRTLPNSFTVSRKSAVTGLSYDDVKTSSTKREGNFMKLTKFRATKIYGDLMKVTQPISPGNRISAFLNSVFASSSKKLKIEEVMQNFRSLRKSRSIKQDATAKRSSFLRSCLSKTPRDNGVKRSVRFSPENNSVILDRKPKHERDPSLMPLPKHERKWYTENMNNFRNCLVNVEDDNEEDDLFELKIVGGVGICAYRQELPVFGTTDLRKIRTYL